MPQNPVLWRSILLPALLSACSAAPPQAPVVSLPAAPPGQPSGTAAPPPPAKAPGTARTAPFGGERWGFVTASSADGRFVVLRRFAGDAKPKFHQHGETSTASELTLFDRVEGTERAIDDLIDVEPARRFLLVIDRGQVWLGDARSGAFRPLEKADMSADGNECLAPRQATFSAKGRRVSWVTGDALRVRDLASGDEWSLKPKGRLWRAWPDDDGRGATLAEIPAGSASWPVQNTSCACRWCGRFAMSYGFYGWSGPAFDIEHVAEDGSRKSADPPEGKGVWHGKTDSGCTLEAASQDHGLERGPWQWKCP